MADPCLRQRLGASATERQTSVRSTSNETGSVQPPRKRAVRRLGLGLVAAVLLGACASSNSTHQETASAPTPTAGSSAAKPLAIDAPTVSLPADPKAKEPLSEPLVDPPPPKDPPRVAAADAKGSTGGGGKAEGGIGLGSVGIIGHGAGTGTGAGYGRLGGSHKTAPSKAAGVWGGSIGESYGAGGLGLSGVGEGGGGGGVASGLSSGSGVSGRAAGSSSDRASRTRRPTLARQGQDVKAGEWDDNANYREYQKYKK